MSGEGLRQAQAAVDAAEAVFREQLLGQRDNRVCASLNSPNGPIILGWDEQGLPRQWTDLNQLHPAQRQNVESYSASPYDVRSNNFEALNLVRIATMTDYTDPSHQAIPDRVNFIVMDDQGQERPLSIDELTALRSIAFAPHFQEGHQQVGDSIQSLPLATDMYCFLIPQNGSGVAILPQPYKDTVGNSNSGAYEEASRTIISELIINDILQKRSESDTGLYLEDAISVLPISTGRREIDGLLNWVLTQENVQDAIRRAEDKTGRLGNLLGRAGLATVFTTDYIKRLIAKSLMPSLRHASLQDLRRLALKMAMRAERTFQPDHFEDDLITTIEPDSEIFDFDPDRPATMRKSGQKDTVPGPGYIGSGREFVHQPGTYQEYDDGTLNLLDEFGYNPRTNSVFALKGWTVNPDGQAVVAQGFELDDDNNPVLVRGYVWNPETRTAALFV